MYVECKCTVNKLDYICKPLCWQQRVCDCNKHCCSAFYFLVEWPSLLYNHKNLCDEYSNIIDSRQKNEEEWTKWGRYEMFMQIHYLCMIFLLVWVVLKGYFPLLDLEVWFVALDFWKKGYIWYRQHFIKHKIFKYLLLRLKGIILGFWTNNVIAISF